MLLNGKKHAVKLVLINKTIAITDQEKVFKITRGFNVDKKQCTVSSLIKEVVFEIIAIICRLFSSGNKEINGKKSSVKCLKVNQFKVLVLIISG